VTVFSFSKQKIERAPINANSILFLSLFVSLFARFPLRGAARFFFCHGVKAHRRGRVGRCGREAADLAVRASKTQGFCEQA